MEDLILAVVEAIGYVLQSVAGDVAEWFDKGSKRKRATEKWVTR